MFFSEGRSDSKSKYKVTPLCFVVNSAERLTNSVASHPIGGASSFEKKKYFMSQALVDHDDFKVKNI